MDRLVAAVNRGFGKVFSPREVWPALIDLRKRGQLPKVGRNIKS
jgi:hypothetical protein